MDWKKIVLNIGGTLFTCLTAHSVLTGDVHAALSIPGAVLAATCVGANLVGLFQRSPKKAPAAPARP